VHSSSFHLGVKATSVISVIAISVSCQLIDLSGIIFDVVVKIQNFEDSNNTARCGKLQNERIYCP